MATPRSNGAKEAPSRFKGCSSIAQYEVMSKLGEGTFGEVHKARSVRSGKIVALKKILMHNEKDGFPITALREIKLLKMLSHVNILTLEEMAVERSKGKERKKAILYMVTPYMDHDLAGLLENPDVLFSEAQIKCYMLQLLEGLRYLHNSHILHRDMKAANLLISNKGILQVADFGLARHYDDPVPQAGRGGGEARREYTTLVVTRWYRPPELLLQLRRYTTAIDMWGVGCVFGEMFKRRPILAGTSDLNQIHRIFELVGSPTEENMPGWSKLPGCDGTTTFAPQTATLATRFREEGSSAISLLSEFLKLDWRKRINAIDALQHPYFRTHPLPAKPHELPTYNDSHELDRRQFRGQKAGPPPAPAGGTVGMGPEGAWAGPLGANVSGPPSRDPRASSGVPERDASGPPRGGYDSRPRVPNNDRYQDNRRPPPLTNNRPGWQSRDEGAPRPLSAAPPTNGSVGRVPHPLPLNPITRANVDTYIPSYTGPTDAAARLPRDDRPPRDDRGLRDDRLPRDTRPPYEDRPAREDRHDSHEGRDHRDRDRDRDRERDRDRDSRSYADRDRDRDRDRRPAYHDDNRPGYTSRADYDGRSRPNGAPNGNGVYGERADRDSRRTRSKSPQDRDRGDRARDRDARDRELYRR